MKLAHTDALMHAGGHLRSLLMKLRYPRLPPCPQSIAARIHKSTDGR